ncbi:MAG: DUF1844 domain-containing protein [Candidatus Omnitrophica bacterium]|nr:DUF1844 domain-containing protein [Candidatus Omnitrophota bacterium]MCA9444000.1 DUF1844 domain-containing protein [Candidatus Omnitrophota bacterium]MCA9450738.1 DUF1844 domain-containing protein [Candidatus Omnitrophota bacterium]
MSEAEKTQPEKPAEDRKEEGIQFLHIASIFFNQGAMALGAMPNPVTGEIFVSFEAVQESIAILEVLKQKSEGNLEPDEKRDLAHMIDELKLAFVQAIRDPRMKEIAERSKQQATPEQAREASRIITPDGRPASSGEGPKIILPGQG